jgi:hypothetical protein
LFLLSRSAHWHHKIELNEFKQTIQSREMEESDSLRRWNIINGLHAGSIRELDLSDELWASSVTMEPFQPDLENIIVALQSNRNLKTIRISNDVLAAIGENNQGRLFRSMGKLTTLRHMTVNRGAGSPTAIHTRVLADALSETSNGLTVLKLSRFKIGSRSEVEQLARGLKARVLGSLNTLMIEGIVFDVEDKTGFLDPILLALAPVSGDPRGQLSYFRLSCVEAARSGASVVSPQALGAFFADEPIAMPRRSLFQLHNLGLNASHCEAMAQALTRDDALLRPIDNLNLTGNLSIGQQGYAALLWLLNRRVDIGFVVVDDQSWQSTFDLMRFMNRTCHRGHFMENGVFPSKAIWVNFLAEIVSARSYWNAEQKLNALWHTLREDPDLICT